MEKTPEDREKMMGQLKVALRTVLDEKGYQRMMNVLLVNQTLFGTAAQKIMMFAKQSGRIVSEREVLAILSALKNNTEKRGDISIIRK